MWTNRRRAFAVGTALVTALVIQGLLRSTAAPAQTPARAPLVFVGAGDNPPFLSVAPNGKPAGYVADMLRALSRESGIPIEIRLVPRAERTGRFSAGEGDLVNVGPNDPLSDSVTALLPLWRIREVAFAVRGSAHPVGAAADLAGRRVAVVSRTVTANRLTAQPPQQRPDLLPTPTPGAELAAVLDGRAEYAVGDYHTMRLTPEYARGAWVEYELQTFPFYLAARRGLGSLQPEFVAAYLRMQESGELTGLIDRSLRAASPHDQSSSWGWYLVAALGFGLIALGGMAYWSHSLRVQVQRRTRELRDAADRQAFQAHVLSQVADAIVVTGADGNVASWNPGAETLFVRRAIDALGRNVDDVVTQRLITHGDDEALREAIRGGAAWKGDAQLVRPSGDAVFVELSIRGIVDQDGRAAGSLIVAHDVDARRATEIEGRQRWRQQASVASLGQRALAGLDFEWLTAQAVSVAADTLQIPAVGIFAVLDGGDEMVLRAAMGWDAMRVNETRLSAQSSGYPGYVLTSSAPALVCNHARETRFAVDPCFARERIAASAACVIPGRSGPYGVLITGAREDRAFSRDDLHYLQGIANVIGAAYERALVDAELRREIALHEATLDATAEGIFVTNASGEVTRYNQRLIDMWGYPPDITAAKDAITWVQFGAAQCEEPASRIGAFEQAASSAGLHVVTIRLRDGRVFERHSQPQVVDGAIVGRVWSYRDITDRVRAEEERRELEAQMQHVQKLESLGVLAGGIAHDFNNLLVGMLGHAALAASDIDPGSPLLERIHQIEAAAQHAAELTNQMLAYSGRGTFVLQRSDLSVLVEEIANLLRTAITKNAELDLHLSHELPAFDGDQAQIRQVVMNLITNASDAIGDAPGRIRVATGVMRATRADLADAYLGADRPEGTYVYVEVADDGCGMDKVTLSRIFDPFFTTKFTGRGLGLAAVLGIVRGHNGAITIVSMPGRGTTFRVLLPATSTPALPAPQPSPMATTAAGTRVLIVDDEAGVRTVAREALRRAGFQVETSEDGEAAVELVRRDPMAFDVVLLDMTMPRMTGVDALHALKELRPNLPVVLTSGYSEQDATARVGRGDIAGFIQKPFKPSTLVRTMHEAVSRGGVAETV